MARYHSQIISRTPLSGVARLDKGDLNGTEGRGPRSRRNFLTASVLSAAVTALPEIAAAQVPAASESTRPPARFPATEGSASTVLRLAAIPPAAGRAAPAGLYGDPYDWVLAR